MATSVLTQPIVIDKPSGKVSGRRRCSCCPYGYHIDLDFVRYCESITNSQLMSTPSTKRSRWNNMKRKRASREALLGLVDTAKFTNEISQTKASQDVGDDLQKAVMDFEKALYHTSLPRGAHIYNPQDWQKYENPKYNSNSLDRYQIRQLNFQSPLSSNKNYHADVLAELKPKFRNDIDSVVDGDDANNASAETLQAIRTQMATSLKRMRELEESIKRIPGLEDQIQELRKENKKLQETIKSKDKHLSKIEVINKTDVATSTTDFCYKRTVGVGCTVLLRDVGSSMFTPVYKSVGIDPITEFETDINKIRGSFSLPTQDPVSLNKIIGTPIKFKFKNAETSTDLNYNEIYTENYLEDGELLKTPVNKLEMKNAETLTELVFSDLFTKSDLDKHVKLYNERKRKSLKTVHTSTTIKQHEIFTQDEVDDEINKHIKLYEKNFINTTLTKKSMMTSVGVQVTSMKRVPETVSVGTQLKLKTFDCGTMVKPRSYDTGIQVRSSVRDIGVSDDTIKHSCEKCNVEKYNISTNFPEPNKLPLINKNHKITNICATKYTDTLDLVSKKDIGLNTTKMKSVSTALDTCDLPCKNCSSEKKITDMPPKRPSYLPILIQRQNTSKTTSPRNLPLRNEESNSDSGSDDGTYTVLQDTSINSKLDVFLTQSPKPRNYQKREPSKEMRGAMKVLNDALQQSPSGNFPKHMKTAVNIVQQEWFKISSVAKSNPLDVEDYLDCFEEISGTLLEYIVNMTDVTGNTAMHYAVSNGNFDVVSILLDSKVCNINKLNTAGYTCIMLVALTKVKSETDREVVRRLFHMADVNIRAKEHGQTALMLAVSHGRIDTVEMLLESGADINIQDEDGSTALMCAAEHGYIDIVKLLLAQPDCDLSITDYDGSTALAIAMDAGNRDVGVLLYAQEHFSRGSSPYTSLKNKRAKSTTPTFKTSRPSTPSHSSNKKDFDISDIS